MWRSSRKISCWTCTHPTHEQRKCPGKKVICFSCGQTGHFKGSLVCSAQFKKKTAKNLPGRAERTSAIAEDTGSEIDSNQVGRVIKQQKENFRALVGPSKKLGKADMTALHHEISSHATRLNLLIDSRVNKTLLSERDWQQIRPCHRQCKPKLKKKQNQNLTF